MKKIKHIIPLFILVLTWLGIAFCCWFKPVEYFSVSERRKLALQPEVELKSVISGKYFEKFEKAALDQFPLRETFRTLKSLSEFYLFGKKDNNDIYISDGYAVKMEYPLNKASVENAVEKLNELYKSYGEKSSGNVYLSIIPDKSYFVSGQTGHLMMDYNALFDMVKEGMPYARYIDLIPSLEISDYYKTDSHWRQENLMDTAEILASAMGVSVSGKYDKITVEKPFYGVYYGQSALPLESDRIHYLSNQILDTCKVYNVEEQKTTGIYNLDKLESHDMYEVYLSGAAPLLSIENSNAPKRELIVFRDSFASSIVPLLAEGYSKITLADTRYIQPSMLGEYVDFSHADILFLYSTTMLNNSQTLR